jgi:ATP-dependent Clp protease ATP-binding subunit ClpA
VIQHRLENGLAAKILAGDFGDGDSIRVEVDPSKHDFTFAKSRESTAPEPVGQRA